MKGEDPTCECGAPLVCFICDSCAEHCLTDGDPDACREAHESWRLGKADPTFGRVRSSVGGEGKPIMLNGEPISPAPRPRWLS
jgi:hypothetical protein